MNEKAAEFNPEVLDKLESAGVKDTCSALLYLLSVYYGMASPHLPDDVVKQVNIARIVERDYSGNITGIKWNIPLFIKESGTTDENVVWLWVEDYRKLFADVKPEARGDKKGCLVKMKRFFAENPDVRKDEILKAALMYLKPFKDGQQDKQYIQQADYFISKVQKGDKTSRLSTFVELVRELAKREQANNSTGSRFNQQVKT